MSRHYPLEIVLRHTGTAELIDATGSTLWASDGDEEFRESVSQEFLTEDDIDNILDYLNDNEILTDDEAARFESDEWDVVEESLEGDDDGDDDSDDDSDETDLE